MTTVTVDYDDLEALLFSTGAIKKIEDAVRAQERDPMVKSASGRLSGAHDRLSAAWRRSKREEPEPPTESDIAALDRMFTDRETGERTYECVVSEYPRRLAQVLQLVESGPAWHGVKVDWPAPSVPEFKVAPHDPTQLIWGVRLMPRGERALETGAVDMKRLESS